MFCDVDVTLQGRGSNPELDAKEAEGRFRDHVENLQKKAVSAFTDLLEQARSSLDCIPHTT